MIRWFFSDKKADNIPEDSAGKTNLALREIQSEKDRIVAILRSMVEQVIAVDARGNILLVNPAAEELFALRNADIVGKPFIGYIRQAALSDLLRFVLETRKEKFAEVRLFFPEEKLFDARALPLKSEGGLSEGAVLVLHDITRIHKLEELRKDFVANVSHELRTPLTSIQGFAETLLSGALSDSRHNREFVETIQSQAQRLTRLVDELLDLSSIESGRKKSFVTDVSLNEILREVADALTPLAKKYGVSLNLKFPGKHVSVACDKDQLKQVFTNLLDNGIKFNKKGGEVFIETENKGTSLTVSIRDTGIGIPESDLSRIFERFYRVDKARSRELGGTGLGLSITKHLLESNGGKIEVKSSLGSGTTFSVTLPLSKATLSPRIPS